MSVLPAGIALRHTPRPEDVAAIRDISESTGFFLDFEVDVAVELIEERLAKGPDSGYAFVFADTAGNGGETVAYACYGPAPCTVGTFDLYWIAVRPEHQGTGLGRALLAAVERAAREGGGRKLYVETAGKPSYEPTRRFYLRCGYVEEARLPDFYALGDAKIFYAKTLLAPRPA